MKKILKISACITAFALLFCVLSLGVFGEEGQADKPETYSFHRYGDVDLDNKITASDARLILRVSAGLENFSAKQCEALEFSESGGLMNVSALTAREILRASAGLSELPAVRYKCSLGKWNLQLDPLENHADSGYSWEYTVTPVSVGAKADGIRIECSKTLTPLCYKNHFGYSPDDIFTFTGVKEGIYRIDLSLRQPWEKNEKPIDSLSFEIEVGNFSVMDSF